MKIAHIVPPNALGHVSDLLGEYHLLLPSLFHEARYRDEYRTRTTSNFYILDNGVVEGHAIDFPHLLAMAKVLGAQEIVLPDCLKNMDKTLRAVAQAFYPAFEHRHKYRYMFVCQGVDIPECMHSAIRAMNLFPGIINSFGIPRHILSKGSHARVTIATRLGLEFPNKPIHLLGMHPQHTEEIITHGSAYQTLGVRGLDTSLAWNAAWSDQLLGPSSLNYNITVERQLIEDFRKVQPTRSQIQLLRDNMKAMNSWL